MRATDPVPTTCAPPRAALRRFAREEDGSMVIFGLFVAMITFVTLGLAVDAMHAEYERTKLQSTCDRSILAAADLDQPYDSGKVVQSYFAAAGLADALDADPQVEETLNSRTVRLAAGQETRTNFLHMVGVDTLSLAVDCAANETVPEVEISLVLDVSGSMNENGRLPRLRTAAREFVDTVIDQDADVQRVSVSIVPFATQVNVGPGILDGLPVTQEHDRSHCVDFDGAAFGSPEVRRSEADPLRRTAHFEVATYARGPDAIDYVCPPSASRQIMPWSHDVGALQAYIDDLQVAGSTSIDIGAKWGTALLDPSMRDIVDDRVDQGLVHAHFRNRPASYEFEEALKVMVIMSDGENFPQQVLKNTYRSGPSGIWVDEAPDAPAGGHADDDYSTHVHYQGQDYWYQHSDIGWQRNAQGQWSYNQNDRGWHTEPHGGHAGARELDWPELFDRVSVMWWSANLHREVYGGDYLTAYYGAFSSISADVKDARTKAICAAARKAGIIVYTVSFEAPSRGQAALFGCASSEAHYFDVKGIEITEAFRAIASQINQLRLVE